MKLLVKGLVLGSALAISASASLAQVSSVPPRPLYTLGSGDKVRVNVFNEEELTGEYSIGPDGSIAMPLVGNISASGLTLTQLRDEIADKLSPDYILDPRVSVEMLNFRPFFILGEVNNPGQYPYVDAMTVAQAVATAGGYTYRANDKRVFIRRKDGTQEVRYSIEGGTPVWVMPGDTIRVGERYF